MLWRAPLYRLHFPRLRSMANIIGTVVLFQTLPMQFVVDRQTAPISALVFKVDLWDADGEVPLDITSANLRATEIHSASRVNISLEQYKELQQFRHALCRVLGQLPELCQDDPDVRFLD